MVANSYDRGWPTYKDGNIWRYKDTNAQVTGRRPCRRCGRWPTREGYDACLGYVPGVTSACCGHGAERPYNTKGDDVKLADLKDELGAILGRDDAEVRARLAGNVHYEVEGIDLDANGVYITVKPVEAWAE